MASVSGRFACLAAWDEEEEEEEQAAAATTEAEGNEVTNSTNQEQKGGGVSTEQDDVGEAGIEITSTASKELEGAGANQGQDDGDGAWSKAAPACSSRSSRQNHKQRAPSSAMLPPPTAATAASMVVNKKKVDCPGGRRFPEYQPYVAEGKGPAYSEVRLWKYLEEPRAEELEKMIYYEDELCVVLYERSPKAQYHLLLVAKRVVAMKPADLSRKHLPSHRLLHDVGRKIAHELTRQGAEAVRCGYHAIPLAKPLHMQIISQDFDSPNLSKSGHWNRLTTEFFLDCTWVEARLKELGSLELDMDKYTKLVHQPVRCFQCGWQTSVKSLKKHNLDCGAPLPKGHF